MRHDCPKLLALALPILVAAFLGAGSGWAAQATSATPTNVPAPKLPTLTTARTAHSLSSEEAARRYPVHLRGVVTYFDPDMGSGLGALFVHDATGSIFSYVPVGSVGPLPAGTLIDLQGVTGPGGFAPIVVQPKIRVIGHSHLPANPPREGLSSLITGTEDGKWVEVDGTVHSVDVYDRTVTLRLATVEGDITVTIMREPGATYSGLVDAKVRIHANAAPTINSNSQMIGVHLMAPNLSVVQIVEPAPGDPFKQPPIPINNLLRWNQAAASFHRVHVRGSVTLSRPGSSLCLQDASGGICTQTLQNTHLAIGDVVDVAGFAGTENNAPVLTDAVFRGAGISALVAAKTVSADQALLGKQEAELIQIDGQLVANDLASSDTTLLLTSGKTVFAAVLPKGLAGNEASAWKIGSMLKVTGVCSVRLDAQRHVREGFAVSSSFRVLMRSPQDIAVLQKPSWWSPGHALVLLALALFGTLVVIAWVVALRKRVAQQTILLRESEERFRHLALHDALTGLATRILLQDRLDVALESARRRRTGLALLMVDLDKFKEINDSYGHQAGDEVLRVAADRARGTVRRGDTVARLGGDEFVILLADLTDPKAAETIAANIVAALSVPISFAGKEIAISASVGVYTAFADELDSDALLRNADAALYRAKAKGRGCFEVFANDLSPAE